MEKMEYPYSQCFIIQELVFVQSHQKVGNLKEIDRKIFVIQVTNLCKSSLSGNIVPRVQKNQFQEFAKEYKLLCIREYASSPTQVH